jgi:Kelch motif
MTLRAFLVALLVAVALAACGGGGGGGYQQPPPPSPQAQSISFANAGPVNAFLDDASYSNPASGGAGTGAITYTSSMPSVAKVEANTGQVTIVAVGDVVITASKAADANYKAAQANYSMHVAPRTIGINAWIGPSDTEVSFLSDYLDMNFTRSPDLGCDPRNYSVCANGTQTSASVSPLTDSVATLQNPTAYWLQYGSNVTNPIVLPEQKFGAQRYFGSTAFNGRHWLVTGNFASPNQVWSSADGSNWRLENASVSFPARNYFKLLAFKSALWVIGGESLSTGAMLNDVWTSSDGSTWTQATSSAFPARAFFAATASDSAMCIAGGQFPTTQLANDVWCSTDGATWTAATTAAPWGGREFAELVSFNGRLWILGGFWGGAYADIWSSADGVSWAQETAQAEFGERFSHRVITDGKQLWLIAGNDGYQSAQRDVWSSSDGRKWTLVTNGAQFSPRFEEGAEYLNGQLWVIGGGDDEVWSSTAGDVWSKHSLSAAVPGASVTAMVPFKNRLFALGDETELWSSANGIDWTEETHTTPAVSSLSQILARPDRLILIAGWQYSAPNYSRQVWQSTDGKSWSLLTNAAPFSATNLNQVVELNGTLLAFAGNDTNETTPEVWSSSDGASWTQVLANAPYGPRLGYRVVVHNNLVYVIGGYSSLSSSTIANDAWSSPDGAVWTQVASDDTLPKRTFGAAVSVAGNMCLYPGSVSLHDVWCSSDGGTWQQRSDDVPNGAFAVLNGTAFVVGSSKSRYWSNDIVWKSADGVSWRLGYQNTLRFP